MAKNLVLAADGPPDKNCPVLCRGMLYVHSRRAGPLHVPQPPGLGLRWPPPDQLNQYHLRWTTTAPSPFEGLAGLAFVQILRLGPQHGTTGKTKRERSKLWYGTVLNGPSEAECRRPLGMGTKFQAPPGRLHEHRGAEQLDMRSRGRILYRTVLHSEDRCCVSWSCTSRLSAA
jgi:hypothetical protein